MDHENAVKLNLVGRLLHVFEITIENPHETCTTQNDGMI